jgi:MSHA pilin protein MshA
MFNLNPKFSPQGVLTMNMKNEKLSEKGFTLIELIITIVIIGVLAAVAIPKFQNLSGDAQKGVASGVGAALASASSVNYARSVVPAATACANGTALGTAGCSFYHITSCADLDANKAALADIPTAPPYAVAAGAGTFANGTTASCTVTDGGATPVTLATFNAYGA